MKIKGELHLHTCYSRDSFIEPAYLEKVLVRKGLSFVAITDHNTFRAVKEWGNAIPSWIIAGEEIKTSEGEIIGLFLNEEIPPLLTPEETIKRIKGQGGVVYIPHPFDCWRRSTISKKALYRILPAIDIIEIFNARAIYPKANQLAERFAQEYNLIEVVGSDAHSYGEIGRSWIELEEFIGKEDFLQKVKQANLKKQKSSFWVHLYSSIKKRI